jgi:integrase
MSVRKRSWTTGSGKPRTKWVVDYVDRSKRRHLKTFLKKRDAEAHHAKVMTEIGKGIHSAGPATVAEAGLKWLSSRETAGLEHTTLVNYRQHLEHHIAPLIGQMKLADLTAPEVGVFEDELRKAGRSPAMVKKILVSLSGILADAMHRGTVAQNVVRARGRSKNGHDAARRKHRPEVGVDIPTPAEIRALIQHLEDGRGRPLLLVAIFTGLRASELRGLRWADVDLDKGEIHVRQRADALNVIGELKSASGRRTIPMLPMVKNALTQWRLACPPDSALVFPSRRGRPLALQTIIRFHHWPAQIAAGLVDAEGKAKYSGFHALRHFYASWCINRKADGGLELPIKVVQGRLGHASIQMTADRYGHLFPRGDDAAELAAAEQAFMEFATI